MSDFYSEHLKNLESLRGVPNVTIEFEHKSRRLMMLEFQIRELREETIEKDKEAKELRRWLIETNKALQPKEAQGGNSDTP